MKTRKLALNAVLAAMCAALGALALDLNSIKITFESFPILLGALLFGPLDGLAVGFVGTLLYQLLRYGVSVTTPLWILPYALAGLVTGFYAKRRGFSLTTGQTVGIVVAAEVLVTALNTLVMYIDAKLYGYWFPGFISAMLLLRGAVKVYAVDAGSGQLAAKLRADARVISMEKYNARLLSPKDFPVPPTLAVMDVSFISQTLILPALYSVLAERALLISLVKPQFEAGREAIGKGGIVKNKADRAAAIRRVADSAALCGFTFCEITPSPITGGDGNEEFLCCFAKGGARPAYAGDVQRRIGQAVGLK